MSAPPLHLSVFDEPTDTLDLKTNIRQIGPVMAQKMLERNIDNRNVKPSKVAQFAEDMRNGRWLFDGAPIRFGADGRLLDGQNRLHAIIQADVTLPFLVIYGIDPAAQVVMDSGSARTAADNLGMQKERNSAALSALVKQAVLYATGRLDKNAIFSVSSIEVAQFLAAHPELREAANNAVRLKSAIEAKPTAIAFVFWLCQEKDYELASEFFTLLSTRANLPAGSPILAVDSRLRQLRKNNQRATVKQEINLLIKAWNLWLDGKTVSQLVLPRPTDPVIKVKP